MSDYRLYITCPKCGGGGIFPFEIMNGEMIPHPPENPVTCALCVGTGKIPTGFELSSDTIDLLNDIKDKCNDIFEKVNE